MRGLQNLLKQISLLLILAVSNFCQSDGLFYKWKYFVSDPFYLEKYSQQNNPAFLVEDYVQNFLISDVNLCRETGSFRRSFDPESQNEYSINFQGIKKLDSNKVFWGSASYLIEDRINVNRSLKYDPYSGEAFFLLDSDHGDTRYYGPNFNAAYSQKVFEKTTIGFLINYEILKGLKDRNSNALTLLRSVGINAGIAHKFSSDFLVGIYSRIYDSQESIEGKGDELTQLELFNYRGEKYFVRTIGNIVKEKIKKDYFTLSPHTIINIGNGELFLSGEYGQSNTKILIPKQQLIDHEEGYSNLEKWKFDLSFFYKLNNNYSMLIKSGWTKNNSWSKNSEKNLLLWKWNTSFADAGINLFYNVMKEKVLLSAGYKFQSANFDSTKYIDNKFLSSTSANHGFNVGLLCYPSSRTMLISEISYRLKDDKIIYAGTDLIEPSVKNIFRIKTNFFELDFIINYFYMKTKIPESKREKFNFGIDLKLSEF